MLVWLGWRCDNDDAWELLHDEDVPLPAGIEICQKAGTTAITVARREPADRVRLTIAPAAVVGDPRTGRVRGERRYLLELSRWNAPAILRSTEPVGWDEAVKQASWF